MSWEYWHHINYISYMNDSDSDTAMIQWIDILRASVACATIGRARMVTLALQVFNQPSSAHPNPRTVPVSRAESPILYSESNSPSQKSLFKWSVILNVFKNCDSEILRPCVFRNNTHFPTVQRPCPHLDAARVPIEWRLAPLRFFGSRKFVTKSDLWEFLI